MENYPDENYLEFLMEDAKNELEREHVLAEMEITKENLKGNINKVSETITNLISKLNLIENLPGLLLPTKRDTIGIESYFSDFKDDKGDGYIGNNFGHDLRNFKRFLEFAKTKGATTVWFNYG